MFKHKVLKAIQKGIYEGMNIFDDDEDEKVVFKKSSVSNKKTAYKQATLSLFSERINMRKAVAKEFNNFNIFGNVLLGCRGVETKLGSGEYSNMNILEVLPGINDNIGFVISIGTLLKNNTWQGYKYKKMAEISTFNYIGMVAADVQNFINNNLPEQEKESLNNVYISLSGRMCALEFKSHKVWFVLTGYEGDYFKDCINADHEFVEDKTQPINKFIKKAGLNVKKLVTQYGFIPKYEDGKLYYDICDINSNGIFYTHLIDFLGEICNLKNLRSTENGAENDDIIIESYKEPYNGVSDVYINGVRIKEK